MSGLKENLKNMFLIKFFLKISDRQKLKMLFLFFFTLGQGIPFFDSVCATTQVMVISFRQSLPHQGIQDNSFGIHPNYIEITRNSNFFEKANSIVKIGHFRLNNSPNEFYHDLILFRQRYLKRIERRSIWEKLIGLNVKAKKEIIPHSFQYILDGKQTSFNSDESEWIENFLEELWLNPEVNAIDAVEVELKLDQGIRLSWLKNGKQISEKMTTISDLKCKIYQSKVWRCNIPNLGQVFLNEPIK